MVVAVLTLAQLSGLRRARGSQVTASSPLTLTLVTLTFDGLIKLGLLGRIAARLLGSPRRLQAILEAYEHELTRDHDGVDR